ncbi:hypothetical protein A3D84_04675 [Candidatus Woesebacteria bacterium RIFCSPHIGHO2_02_FULL_42_20]|uniref:DUF3800 domain-containing protein n=1 Tax=Candidatus Woesebacteria bacterium RIFCSPHIGHO2_12_FULL_41_24 TaxID=1802510 RepID=A0A1F8AWC5_9BACT|nr:MAG: hypothetical protein A2W15_00215 [Candidatus Woesebacteria bacterium RBG_16_41_13]OGM30996.1 MAG: hypothetical protein A2873_01845 [Candidatus Woesebacteria bacterium RIFCSPHIGHO2_01_FULL_42_80]OGM34474.1 MAG: hypothetical protein A3D84_04675 [Candidatus Woesebacteria bacterium RIFCSPHIGHO2_02_FULL_42_20]OGM55558.1 MAG: hypothetical protein A3E44_04815 [Candidatus Woesebacteria bacterium RIFCSPHIGHO2_12_FULL_41_24]OGM67365.1 MAG: hypothetical protein A2969_02900 [Candidatus Woesebacteri
MLVFIDDSGDPGFKFEKGSSKIFVIAMVIFNDDLEAEKTSVAIKETRRKLKVSDLYEFKFNKANRKFRNTFFGAIKKFDFEIRAVVINKSDIQDPKFKERKFNFYNFVIKELLKQSEKILKNARINFDRRGEKNLRDQLRVYLSRELNN